MPIRPHIELVGQYHVINRGVAYMRISEEPADYEYFEELMCYIEQNTNT